MANPEGKEELRDGDPGGAGAIDDHADVLDFLAGELEGVMEGRGDHDRGAVLVVVEDGDVEFLLEAGLDLEAAGGADVLEVDAAEGTGHELDGLDDFLRVFGAETDGIGVDVSISLEEGAFAFHDGHAGFGADVP